MKRTASHRRLVWLCIAALVVLSVRLSGQDAPTDTDWTAPARAARKKNPVPADDAAIAAGKLVYASQCLQCHGAAGKGDGPAAKDLTPKPRDLSDARVAQQTDGALFWKITQGKKPMPTFENLLGETQRWQVIDYIRTLGPKPTSQPSEGSQP